MNFHPFKAVRAAIIQGVHTAFGYHAVLNKPRRTAPKTTTNSEDNQLNKTDRRTLIADTRESLRSYPVLQWLVNTSADYIAPHRFQATNDDEELNDKLEQLMKWWSHARNCDTARRHHLQRMIRMWEIRRMVDGDVGILLTPDGRLQNIEGDRIATPNKDLPRRFKNANPVHGVILDKFGADKLYLIAKRDNAKFSSSTQLTYERAIQAANMILFKYADRFDQVRGVSPLATINTSVKDLGEAMVYANTKMKNHMMLGMAITRDVDPETGIGEFDHTDQDTGEEGTENTTAYEYELRDGLKLDLPPGAKVDMLESKQPSSEFQTYVQLMTHFILSSRGVPMTFWDSGAASMSSMRQDLNRYVKSINAPQADVREVLDRVTAWKIGTWAGVRDPEGGAAMLPLPEGMKPRDVKWEWLPAGIPLFDPLKDVNAHAIAVSNGFETRDQVSRQNYTTRFSDNVAELGKEEAQAVAASATIAIGQPGQVTTRDEEKGNEANETGGTGDAE